MLNTCQHPKQSHVPNFFASFLNEYEENVRQAAFLSLGYAVMYVRRCYMCSSFSPQIRVQMEPRKLSWPTITLIDHYPDGRLIKAE